MVHSFPRVGARPGRIGRGRQGLTLMALLLLAGCASIPPPDAAMSMAQNQLQAARDADAADYAPVDLGFAQNKFQQAQDAMAKRKYEDAANLASEARADAELALAKARLGDARAKIQAKIEDNKRLREQMERAHPELSDSDSSMPAGSALPVVPASDMPAAASSSQDVPAAGGFQTVPDTAPTPAGSSSQENQP